MSGTVRIGNPAVVPAPTAASHAVNRQYLENSLDPLLTPSEADAAYAPITHTTDDRPHPATPQILPGTTGDVNIDASSGRYFRFTMGGDRQLAATTNAVDGMMILLEMSQDSTGNRTLSLDDASSQGWRTGANPVNVSLGPNERTYFVAVYHGPSAKWNILGSRIGFVS